MAAEKNSEPLTEEQRRLVEANLSLVERNVFAKRYLLADKDDYIQDGSIGLISAVQKFDPDRETPFEAVAHKYIKGAINRARYKSGLIHVPEDSQYKSKRAAKLEPFRQDVKRAKSVEWIDDFDHPPCATAEDSTEINELAEKAMSVLTDRERAIVSGRIWFGETYSEAGDRVGVKKFYASQIEKKALAKMRVYLESIESEAS